MGSGSEVADKKLAQDILDDSGYKSRKLAALCCYWILCIGGLFLALWKTDVAGMYATFCTALTAGLALYFGVNATNSFAAVKAEQAIKTEAKPAAKPTAVKPPLDDE